jgi:hypothetical protein
VPRSAQGVANSPLRTLPVGSSRTGTISTFAGTCQVVAPNVSSLRGSAPATKLSPSRQSVIAATSFSAAHGATVSVKSGSARKRIGDRGQRALDTDIEAWSGVPA